jgi:5'-3' exonuclease
MEFKVGSSTEFIKKAVGTPVLHHKNQVSLEDLQSQGKPVILLIDADIVAYRCSAVTDGRMYTVAKSQMFSYKKDAEAYCATQGVDPKEIELIFNPEPESNATANVDKLLNTLKRELQGRKMENYLTPDTLFRHDFMGDYKKNRDGLRKPHHLKACKKHLETMYFAEKVDGYEADDLLAIRAKQLIAEGKYTPVIVSLDKDLDMVSCFHYQWTKKCIYFITPEEGTLNFYKQLLTGDKTDNIPGLFRVGPKTAETILKDCDGSSSYECYIKVLEAYLSRTPREDGEDEEDFTLRVVQMVTRNARLLYILNNLGEVWYPPVKVEETLEDEMGEEQDEG